MHYEKKSNSAHPESRNPEPKTRNPEPKTRNPELKTRNSELETQNPELKTRNSELETQNPEPKTRNPEPATRNPELKTRNAKLETQNPKPVTHNSELKTQNPKPETQHIPSVIAWETTRRCTLKCQHCRGSALDCDYAGEFSTEEFFRTIDHIASSAKPMIILTGGEPMMRDDIYDIARYATDKGLRVVMAPCGHLINEQTAARLKASGVMAISISIDGATEAEHDAFRGVPGAFAKTIQGLQFAIDAGIPFQVNTTVTKQNIDAIPAIYEKAIELGAKTFDLFFLVPTGRGSELKELEISPEQAESLLKWVVQTKRTSSIRVKTTCAPHVVRVKNELGDESRDGGCMGGKGFVFISHTGILQPCGFFDVPCGDLRAADYDFKTLYETSPVFNDLRDESKYKGKCGDCEFVTLCSGCRARALSATGDYLDAEPTCSHQPELGR